GSLAEALPDGRGSGGPVTGPVNKPPRGVAATQRRCMAGTPLQNVRPRAVRCEKGGQTARPGRFLRGGGAQPFSGGGACHLARGSGGRRCFALFAPRGCALTDGEQEGAAPAAPSGGARHGRFSVTTTSLLTCPSRTWTVVSPTVLDAV